MPFSKNHDHLYFDNLRRTQKAETVNSLIHASYQGAAKSSILSERKKIIARLLKNAYDLYGVKADTYVGELSQFDSQYTIGHELGIWVNSNLDLNDLAKKVANHEITIRDYFDVVFLNYIQIIDNKIVHPLHDVAKYIVDNNLSEISKNDFDTIYSWVSKPEKNNINGLFHMLSGTSYFSVKDSQSLIVNISARELLNCCNIDCLKKEIKFVVDEFRDLNVYVNYLIQDHRSMELMKKPVCSEIKSEFCGMQEIKTGGFNKIFYGAPGCGKSYLVSSMLKHKAGFVVEARKHGINQPVNVDSIVRTTFHMDYSYTDFVGQVYPVVEDEKVSYKYVPGPFTKAIEKAYKNPNEMIYLIIEEINRGNAASIFGDLFQLLDRKKGEEDGEVKGESEYSISNTFIEGYFNELASEGDNVPYKKNNIIIPANLTIFATMNTSDQNVFTLDTAFKRRWEFKKLTNKFDDTHTFAQYFVPGMINYTWKDVVESVNEYIADNSDTLMNEDKQIGVYFVEKETLAETADEATQEKVEAFAYKLLEYLWDDVVKFDRSKMFKNAKTFDQLVAEYQENGEEVFVDGIIKHHK